MSHTGLIDMYDFYFFTVALDMAKIQRISKTVDILDSQTKNQYN